jgi:hypothetical protein
MRFSKASLLAAAVTTFAIGASPVACNVFVSIGKCSGNADCQPGATCDLEARICVAPEAAPGAREAGADAPLDGAADADADVVLLPPSCNLDAGFVGAPRQILGLPEAGLTSARFNASESRVFFSAYTPGCTNPNLELCSQLSYGERVGPGSYLDKGELGGVNEPNVAEYLPTLSPDERLIVFESSRSLEPDAGVYANDRARIWRAIQQVNGASFDLPVIRGTFGQTDPAWSEGAPYLLPRPSAAETKVYFMSNGRTPNAGSFDLFVTELNGFGAPGLITNIGGVNTTGFDGWPVISSDDTVLYFGREGAGNRHIYVSERVGPAIDDFGAPRLVPELDGMHDQFPTWISHDNCRLYFMSNRPKTVPAEGPFNLWVVERPPEEPR